MPLGPMISYIIFILAVGLAVVWYVRKRAASPEQAYRKVIQTNGEGISAPTSPVGSQEDIFISYASAERLFSDCSVLFQQWLVTKGQRF
jgi:hypothetical protein